MCRTELDLTDEGPWLNCLEIFHVTNLSVLSAPLP